MPRVWFKNVHHKLIRTKKEFEFWLADLDEAVTYFVNLFPEEIRSLLDYSPESLDVLESIILERYSCVHEMMARYQMTWVEDAGLYVGEVFRRKLNGYWSIDLKRKSYVYFQMPVVVTKGKHFYGDAPRTLVTAACDRRTGNFIRTCLEKRE